MSKKSADQAPLINLNFKVTEAEKWAFKTLCAQNHLSQTDGFREAVQLLEAVKTAAPGVSAETFSRLFAGVREIDIDLEYEISLVRRSGLHDEPAWAVSVMGTTVVTREGQRVHEPRPSSRDDDFIAATRFTLAEALEIATRYRAKMMAGEDA